MADLLDRFNVAVKQEGEGADLLDRFGVKPEGGGKETDLITRFQKPQIVTRPRPQMVIPQREGHWKGWIKPSLVEAGRRATVGTAETTLALASPILTWPAAKLSGLVHSIWGEEAARQAEQDVMSKGYQPLTKEGYEAVEKVGKLIEKGLIPAKMAGQEFKNMGLPRLGYWVETLGELATFEAAGGIGRGIKAGVKAKQGVIRLPKEKKAQWQKEAARKKEITGKLRAPERKPLAKLAEKETEIAKSKYKLKKEHPSEKLPYRAIEPIKRMPTVEFKRGGELVRKGPETKLKKGAGVYRAVEPISEKKMPEVYLKTKEGLKKRGELVKPKVEEKPKLVEAPKVKVAEPKAEVKAKEPWFITKPIKEMSLAEIDNAMRSIPDYETKWQDRYAELAKESRKRRIEGETAKPTLTEARGKAVIAERKAKATQEKQAASQKRITGWIAKSGGIKETELAGEIRDLIYTMDAKGKKKLVKGIMPGFLSKRGRGLDEVVRDAREAGFDVKNTDHLLELIERDLGGQEVRRLTDESLTDKMLAEFITKEKDRGISEREARESVSREVIAKVKSKEEFADTPTNELEAEYNSLSKEVSFKPEEIEPAKKPAKELTFEDYKDIIRTELAGKELSTKSLREWGEKRDLKYLGWLESAYQEIHPKRPAEIKAEIGRLEKKLEKYRYRATSRAQATTREANAGKIAQSIDSLKEALRKAEQKTLITKEAPFELKMEEGLPKLKGDIPKQVENTINKYLDRFEDSRPATPPVKNVVFRRMKDAEWEAMQKGKESGGFWSSDPTEYGRHALGEFGKPTDNVLVAASFDPKDGKIYRGLVKTPEEAKVAHFQSTKTKGLGDVIAVYKWRENKLVKIYPQHKKAVFPEEKIKTATKGKQESILPEGEGKTYEMFESLGFQYMYETLVDHLKKTKPQRPREDIRRFDRGRIVKQRKAKGITCPPVYEAELGIVKKVAETDMSHPVLHGMQNPGRKFDQHFGEDFKSMTYWQIQEAKHRADLEFKDFQTKVKGFKKQVPHASSKRIKVHEIAQQKGGKARLKAQGITDIPQLTPKEMNIYRKGERLYEEFYHRLNKARKRAGKEPFGKVQNYGPFIHDLGLLEEMGLSPGLDRLKAIEDKFVQMRAAPFRHAKKRAPFYAKPLDLDYFGTMDKYGYAAINHIHMSPTIAKLHEYTLSFGEGKAKWRLQEAAPNKARWFRAWLDHVAGKPTLDLGPVDRGLTHLNKNAAFAILGGNVRSALIQPSALMHSYVELGHKYTLEGIASLLDPKKRNFALEKSNHLLGRNYDVAVRDFYDLVRKGQVGKIQAAVGKGSLKGLQILDTETAMATWQGAYNKAIKDLNYTEAKAIRYADDVTIRTQASASRADIAPIQRSRLGRALTLFQTFVINEWNFMMNDVLGYKNPKVKGVERLSRMTRFIVGTTLVNMFYEDVMGLHSPFPSPIRAYREAVERGDDWPSRAKEVFKELIEKVPILGSARYGTMGPAWLSKTAKAIYKGKNYPETIGTLLGVPGTTQFKKMIRATDRGGTPMEIVLGGYPMEKKGKLVRPKTIKLKKLKGLKGL